MRRVFSSRKAQVILWCVASALLFGAVAYAADPPDDPTVTQAAQKKEEKKDGEQPAPSGQPPTPFQPPTPGVQPFGPAATTGVDAARAGPGAADASTSVVPSAATAPAINANDVAGLLNRSTAVTGVETQQRNPVMNDPRVRGYRVGQRDGSVRERPGVEHDPVDRKTCLVQFVEQGAFVVALKILKFYPRKAFLQSGKKRLETVAAVNFRLAAA